MNLTYVIVLLAASFTAIGCQHETVKRTSTTAAAPGEASSNVPVSSSTAPSAGLNLPKSDVHSSITGEPVIDCAVGYTKVTCDLAWKCCANGGYCDNLDYPTCNP